MACCGIGGQFKDRWHAKAEVQVVCKGTYSTAGWQRHIQLAGRDTAIWLAEEHTVAGRSTYRWLAEAHTGGWQKLMRLAEAQRGGWQKHMRLAEAHIGGRQKHMRLAEAHEIDRST